MSEILTLPTEVEEYEDEEEVLEAASEDADEVSDEYRNPFPPEYVVGQLGHRGGGKSALLAYFGFNCLAAGEDDHCFLSLSQHGRPPIFYRNRILKGVKSGQLHPVR